MPTSKIYLRCESCEKNFAVNIQEPLQEWQECICCGVLNNVAGSRKRYDLWDQRLRQQKLKDRDQRTDLSLVRFYLKNAAENLLKAAEAVDRIHSSLESSSGSFDNPEPQNVPQSEDEQCPTDADFAPHLDVMGPQGWPFDLAKDGGYPRN